ncbi:serine/threonine-protein kinase [Mycolicibacterium sp. BK556]|uniref:PASTA domain-containing protein n=1 Tax=unclassified Mycolicibacterium TaxID=2636767 RepID=UPI0010619F43|nr:serine/threonine-protein kinase [Mycolicibacterium sp. BK556]MBB3631163.1 serine/threonine-protein kinase [Mycolicibacterium sp. BK607]MBB3749165.1 serine/threonine-protein kinase [Mycolicibacterium sp. BK634]
MKALRALIFAASTACVLGACTTGGHSVVATDSTTTTAVAPTIVATTPTRPHDLVMPDLRGMYWADAEPALRTIGWTGVLEKAADIPGAPYRKNSIAAQVPAPGQVIASDAVITLQFAS